LRKLCFDCKNFTPRRGYHCDVCRTCIPQYDHHCTWINNCVGKRNIGRFIFFLIFLILSLGLVGLLALITEITLFADNPDLYSDWIQLRYVHQNGLERGLLICLLGVNVLTALFVFPVAALCVVQMRNLLNNKTTYEMIHSPKEEDGVIKEKMRKYNSKMTLRNCKVMCSDNKTSVSSSFVTERFEEGVTTSKLSPNKILQT
jgi:hypothetical protein